MPRNATWPCQPGLRLSNERADAGRGRPVRTRLKLVRTAAMIGTFLALSACGRTTPETALVAAQPAADPVRPLTPYSDALSCINNQLRAVPGRPVTLTVGSVPDATGRITPGLRDMITSAAAEVAAGGQHFDLTEVAVAPELGFGSTGVRPNPGGALIGIGPVRLNGGLQLIGALTQADRDNQSTDLSAGGSYQNNTVDAATTDDISTLALDLRLVDISNGLSITNSTRSLLAVHAHGTAANAALTIGSFGASFSYNLNRQEGAHQAVRTLVELSVAELLGQAARVPYWTCLKVDRQSPAIMERLARWYNDLTPAARDQDVRDRLRAAGYRVPEPPGSAADAIVAFQHRNNLVPTGGVDFETYARLITAQLPAGVSSAALPDDPPAPGIATLAAAAPGAKGADRGGAGHAIATPTDSGKI